MTGWAASSIVSESHENECWRDYEWAHERVLGFARESAAPLGQVLVRSTSERTDLC